MRLVRYRRFNRMFAHPMTILKRLFLLLVCSGPVQAGEFVEWHQENIQVLRGFDYELGPKGRTIVTLEHVNRWKYGDFFWFMDFQWPDGGDFTFYSEITPRFSLSKMSGRKLGFGLVKDIYIAGNLEIPKNASVRYLYGPSVDLDLPGFTFFKTFFFIRDNPDIAGSTHQVTIAWKRFFKLGRSSLLLEGFTDMAGNEGSSYAANELVVPRALFDVSTIVGVKPRSLWAGIEYTYWHNKFGLRGVTESAAQLQLKWSF